jgi:phytoene desaturase
MDRFEQLTQQSLKNNIIFKIAFCKMILLKSITPIKGMPMEWLILYYKRLLRPTKKSKKNVIYISQDN